MAVLKWVGYRACTQRSGEFEGCARGLRYAEVYPGGLAKPSGSKEDEAFDNVIACVSLLACGHLEGS